MPTRLCLLGLLAATLALPTTAQANQTLTVEPKGAGTGTVKSSPAGIDCGATCSFAFADSTIVLLTGTAAANSAPVIWSGCEAITVEKKCKVTMSAAKTVTATFNLAKRKLSVEPKGTGIGTVKSSPAGIECPSTCSAEYDHGTEVTLTGIPGADTDAVKWSGCTSVNGEGKCLVSMTAAKTVTATFNFAKRELKVKKAALGTGTVTSSPAGINCGSTCSAIFNEGTTVTLTGTPTGETETVKWAGCDSVNGEGKCLVTMSSAREVAAIFNVKGPQLSIIKVGNGTGTVTSSPAAIECGQACAVNFVKGSTVALTGTPGLHTLPVKWAGCDSVTADGKCLVSMTAAREVAAAFSLEPQWIEYTVSVRAKGTGKGTIQSFPAGISCPGDCSEVYLFHTPLTLIATPEAGSEFAHWSGGCSGIGPCERKVNSSLLVNAVFTAVGSRKLTVAKAGAGQGTVTSKPVGIDCGQTCSAELDAATKVVLSATPASASTFAGWSGEGCSGAKTCRLLMNEARNVTATFAANPSPSPRCTVPRLAGKSLARARSALSAAHCALGKVRKPKGARLARLRVRSSSPAAGTTLAGGARVNVRLGPARGR